MSPADVFALIDYRDESRTAGRLEIHKFGGDLGDELRAAVWFKVPFRHGAAALTPVSSEARPQVAYLIDLLRSFPFTLVPENFIVYIFEIPVVEKRHCNSQCVQLSCVRKRTLTPTPVTELLFALHMSLQPNIVHRTVGGDQFVSAVQAPGHLGNS